MIYQKSLKVKNKRFIIKSLAEIDDVFSEKVEEYTNDYLEKNGLNDTAKILKKLLDSI